MRKPTFVYPWFVMFLASHAIAGDASLTGRNVIPLNEGWSYLERNFTDPARAVSAGQWISVSIPHTWNAWDTTDLVPGYRRDASWYRRPLVVPNRTSNRRYVLHFEGAAMTTDVYVDGRRAGGHVGGYVGFDVDITPFVRAGDTHDLLVRVSNTYNPDLIPSQKADHFIYGGITRDVWLKELPPTSVDRIQVLTSMPGDGRAEVAARVWTSGPVNDGHSFAVSLIAPDGRIAQRITPDVSESGESKLAFAPLVSPELWSVDTPNLYRLRVELNERDAVVDTVEQTFGIRRIEFRERGGFYLNGERLLLRGTHLHEDAAGYGGAVPDEVKVRDLTMIKAMGANFVRLAHYPHDPVVYATADRLGLLVWDELPWNRGGVGGERWLQNTERLLRAQIAQNFNHPSIITWSLGNEIYWLPDFAGGDEVSRLDAALRHLHGIAKTLDPDRPTSIRKYENGAGIVDLFSPSIWAGWYRGVYTDYEAALRDARAKYLRFVHMEYGGSSHVGRHTETPVDGHGVIQASGWTEDVVQSDVRNIARDGDWSESYIVDLFDWHLSVSERFPDFTGNAQWVFKDFGTPLRPENDLPHVNQKGLVDRAGRPKDAYYVFKSYWTRDPAFCWLESHTWTERQGPAGQKRTVNAYCNTDSARLVVNGVDLGRRDRELGRLPAAGLSWQVVFAEGENRLEVIGYNNDEEVTRDDLAVTYYHTPHGRPATISLSREALPDGDWLLVATTLDEHGRRVLDYEEPVYFAHDGAGYLHTGYGTPDGSQRISMANGRASIRFTPGKDRAVVSVLNQEFKGSFLEIPKADP